MPKVLMFRGYRKGRTVEPYSNRLPRSIFNVIVKIMRFQFGVRQPFDDDIAVLQLDADPMAFVAFADIEGRAAAAERIEYHISFMR